MKRGTKQDAQRGRPGLRAEEALKLHPKESAANIARMTGTNIRTVYNARNRLIRDGIVPPDYFPLRNTAGTYGQKHPEGGSASPELTHEDLGFKNDNLSTEESLKMLTTLARDGFKGGNYAQTKGSIETHDKLRQRSAVSTLGPVDPQSDAEKIDRLAVLIDVCGPILTASAVLKAFWNNPERELFFGESARQQSTRALGINPWGKTATGSPPITPEDLLDGKDDESQEGPTVAKEYEDDSAHSGSSDPLD